MRAVLLFMVVLVAGQVCYGQSHDDPSRPGDPVKFVQVYPNPAVDYLSLKFESAVAKTSKVEIHSIIGSAIEVEQEIIDEFEIRVKVKDLPVGYYVIAVHDPMNNTRGIYKFLKR
jgi:hypothetical protein